LWPFRAWQVNSALGNPSPGHLFAGVGKKLPFAASDPVDGAIFAITAHGSVVNETRLE
jgi:hypothetical protein